MKNSTSKEAFYERLRQLSEVDKSSVKEIKTRNLGTLIDYKRAADGVAYGIIKEQHHYYVKKGGLKQDPDASDFAYIGGLANITNFQYKSLSEAEKQRNMMLHTINEAYTLKADKNGSKRSKLNEDKAAEEIKASEEMAAGLDAAADAEKAPAEPAPMGGGDEVPAEMPPMGGEEGGEELPAEMPEPEGGEGEEAPAEEPAPEGGEGEELPAEMPEPEGEEGEEAPEGEEGEEAPEGEEGGEVTPDDEKSLKIKDIEKTLGKLTQKIRSTELEPSLIKGYIQSYLKSFKDKIDDLEIEERKDLADLLLKVVPDDEIEDVASSVPQNDDEETGVPAASEEEPVAEEMCAECGSFGKYAESRGYTKESLMECGEEEMTNLVSGYANAFNDGQNDGDFKVVALLVTPEMVEKLKGEYGHDDYAEKLTPYTNELSESTEEEKMAQLEEAWKDVWGGVKQAGREIGAAAKQAATGVKQAYHSIGVNPAFNKLASVAADLGKQINAANEKAKKAGQNPVPVQAIMDKITQQITSPEAIGKSGQQLKGAAADAWRLGKTAKSTAGNVNLSGGQLRYAAEGSDPANVEVQPDMLREDDEPEEIEGGGVDVKDGVDFAPAADNLGAAINKPEGAGVEIEVTPDKTVKIEMSEAEKKLRKYIRERLEVLTGAKKESLNESKKSPRLKKLDGMIAEQFNLYGKNVKKKDNEVKSVSKKIQETYSPDGSGFPEPGSGDGINPRELKQGEKYTWFMGAEPLECTFVGHSFQPMGFKFVLRNSTHILGGKDVRDYIYPIDVYNEHAAESTNEGFGDKLVNKVNQSVEGKYKKQKELKAAIEQDPNSAKSALIKAFALDLAYNAGMEKFIGRVTPENALEVAQQAANDPDGLGKLTAQGGKLVYLPVMSGY